ncbi:hypothetical protein [Longimicrobium sp.]|uniref:hypothetical protein n=1 Tax=Longimicrobium sp. TaxID=2029185 RepID=UPI002E2FD29E|nr:hypothetical protein [Longimicrobium sp.]HEX6038985.1 hypothetical protein [Longimicrobium sp.]
MNAYDARAEVARVSRRPLNEKAELRAFLESKRRMIRANPHLTSAERAAALANIDQAQAKVERAGTELESEGDAGGVDGGDDDPPLPGGIGFGVFYRSAYKTDFGTGTAAEYTILCPTFPGGDVHSWLYLTAMNRASLSAEALVAYEGQRECVFRLYDWSRQDRWQVPMTYAELRPYLHGCVLNGEMHQALRVLTITYRLAEDSWRNEVFLENASTGQMGLIYVRACEATLADQQDGWEGSWGPIIETFQDRHHGTEEMGFADFSVSTRRGDEWGPWERLSPADTFVAQDDTGFRMLYLEPNHTFLAAA